LKKERAGFSDKKIMKKKFTAFLLESIFSCAFFLMKGGKKKKLLKEIFGKKNEKHLGGRVTLLNRFF